MIARSVEKARASDGTRWTKPVCGSGLGFRSKVSQARGSPAVLWTEVEGRCIGGASAGIERNTRRARRRVGDRRTFDDTSHRPVEKRELRERFGMGSRCHQAGSLGGARAGRMISTVINAA